LRWSGVALVKKGERPGEEGGCGDYYHLLPQARRSEGRNLTWSLVIG